MSTCVTGNIDLHSRDTVRTCARASRRKVIVHGGKREYALHKTSSSVSFARTSLFRNTHTHTPCLFRLSPCLTLPPILHQGYQHGCCSSSASSSCRLSNSPQERSCTVRLRNGRSWNAPRNWPRLESVHLPRLVKSSRRTRRIYERGDQKGGRERERRVTLEGCSAHGLGIIQRLRWRHNDRSPR